MMRSTVADTILKLFVSVALAAGVGWNMWLTNAHEVMKDRIANIEAERKVDDLRFQYISDALTQIQTALVKSKPVVKVIIPPVPKKSDDDGKHFDPWDQKGEKK